MDSVIQITMPGAIAGGVAFLATVFGFSRLLMAAFHQRMEAIENELKRDRGSIEALDARLRELHASLPVEYVRREDWIRFSVTIDAKLDRVVELIHKRGLQ